MAHAETLPPVAAVGNQTQTGKAGLIALHNADCAVGGTVIYHNDFGDERALGEVRADLLQGLR